MTLRPSPSECVDTSAAALPDPADRLVVVMRRRSAVLRRSRLAAAAEEVVQPLVLSDYERHCREQDELVEELEERCPCSTVPCAQCAGTGWRAR